MKTQWCESSGGETSGGELVWYQFYQSGLSFNNLNPSTPGRSCLCEKLFLIGCHWWSVCLLPTPNTRLSIIREGSTEIFNRETDTCGSDYKKDLPCKLASTKHGWRSLTATTLYLLITTRPTHISTHTQTYIATSLNTCDWAAGLLYSRATETGLAHKGPFRCSISRLNLRL